jgi:hypothetical protein
LKEKKGKKIKQTLFVPPKWWVFLDPTSYLIEILKQFAMSHYFCPLGEWGEGFVFVIDLAKVCP